jgi:hypothetical protein
MEDTCIVQEVDVVYLSTLPLRDAMPSLTLKLVPALPSLTIVGPLISASLQRSTIRKRSLYVESHCSLTLQSTQFSL